MSEFSHNSSVSSVGYASLTIVLVGNFNSSSPFSADRPNNLAEIELGSVDTPPRFEITLFADSLSLNSVNVLSFPLIEEPGMYGRPVTLSLITGLSEPPMSILSPDPPM